MEGLIKVTVPTLTCIAGGALHALIDQKPLDSTSKIEYSLQAVNKRKAI